MERFDDKEWWNISGTTGKGASKQFALLATTYDTGSKTSENCSEDSTRGACNGDEYSLNGTSLSFAVACRHGGDGAYSAELCDHDTLTGFEWSHSVRDEKRKEEDTRSTGVTVDWQVARAPQPRPLNVINVTLNASGHGGATIRVRDAPCCSGSELWLEGELGEDRTFFNTLTTLFQDERHDAFGLRNTLAVDRKHAWDIIANMSSRDHQQLVIDGTSCCEGIHLNVSGSVGEHKEALEWATKLYVNETGGTEKVGLRSVLTHGQRKEFVARADVDLVLRHLRGQIDLHEEPGAAHIRVDVLPHHDGEVMRIHSMAQLRDPQNKFEVLVLDAKAGERRALFSVQAATHDCANDEAAVFLGAGARLQMSKLPQEDHELRMRGVLSPGDTGVAHMHMHERHWEIAHVVEGDREWNGLGADYDNGQNRLYAMQRGLSSSTFVPVPAKMDLDMVYDPFESSGRALIRRTRAPEFVNAMQVLDGLSPLASQMALPAWDVGAACPLRAFGVDVVSCHGCGADVYYDEAGGVHREHAGGTVREHPI
eukprot:g7414.t1